MVTSSGSSPVIIMGLDPGITYTVKINLYDGDQVMMSNITVTDTVTVSSNAGKIHINSTFVLMCTCSELRKFKNKIRKHVDENYIMYAYVV